MGDGLSWKYLSHEVIRKDRWIDFRANRYELPDGSVLEPFYTYHKCDFVVIVATDTAGDYICVRQYRPGTGEVMTEFPAGGIEDGESPLDAARRELLEETGFEGGRWTEVICMAPNATIADNHAYIFRAEDCVRRAEQALDSTEFVERFTLPKERVREMVLRGEFPQAVHIAAYFAAEAVCGSH